MIITNAQVSLIFNNITIKNDFNFIYIINLLFILFDYLNFNNFENIIDLSKLMTVYLQDCKFYFIFFDILNTDGLDCVVISRYNLSSIDLVMLDEGKILGYIYINISLDQRNMTTNILNNNNNSTH